MTLYILHAIIGAKTCKYCHDRRPVSDISWTVLTGEFPSMSFPSTIVLLILRRDECTYTTATVLHVYWVLHVCA